MEANTSMETNITITPKEPSSLKKYNVFLIILIIFVGALSVYSSTFYFTEHKCDGIGCLALLPFMIPALPAYPAAALVGNISIINLVIGAPSFFKYLAFFLVFLTISLEGLVGLVIYTSYKSKPGEFGITFKPLATRYSLWVLMIFLLFSLCHFVVNPPAPFVSDEKIISYCVDKGRLFGDEYCIPSFVNYRLAKCSASTNMFLFPLEQEFREQDGCSVQNMITKNLFANTQLRQYFPNGDKTVAQRWPDAMNTIISMFDKAVRLSPKQTQIDFCNSFSSTNVTSGTKNDPKNNRDYCISWFGLKNAEQAMEEEYFCKNAKTASAIELSPVLMGWAQEKGKNYQNFPEYAIPTTLKVSPDMLIHWKTEVSADWLATETEGYGRNGDKIPIGVRQEKVKNFPVGKYTGSITITLDSCGTITTKVIEFEIQILDKLP